MIALWLCPAIAVAQDFPNKTIRLIVPFPPGGPNNIIARVVGQRMSEILKQPIVIDNRSGQGSVVGTDVVHAAVLLTAAAIAHIVAGNVDFGLVGAILIGSIPGIWIGSHMVVRLPSGVLRTALGVVMVGSALALFDKAGIDIPVAVTISVLVALVIAIARSIPGPVFFPIRVVAIGYTDFFRGIPLILLIYVIGFGVPAAIGAQPGR